MVEVSNLRNLSIYTNNGQYVGQVYDIVLNIRLGTISKLQVKAIEPERKPVGLIDSIRDTFQGVPDDGASGRSFQNDLLTVDFDKVQAIGDIILINPRDIKKVNQDMPMPNPISPNPKAQSYNPETKAPFENKSNFE